MPDKRDLEALIERAVKAGAEVTIVTIGGRTSPQPAEAEPQPQTSERPPAPRPSHVAEPVFLAEPESGALVEANRAFHAWSGIPAGMASNIAELDPEGRLRTLMRRAMETGQPISARASARAAAGVVAVEAVAVPMSGAGRALVQIVLRERAFIGTAETELRRALRRVSEILNALPSPLLTLDADGRIRSANPAAEELLARGPAVIGLNMEALAAPISAQALRELLAAADGEGPSRTVEIALNLNGQAVPVDCTLISVGEAEERVTIAVLRDLRREREAELARAQLLGRYHQAQKLEAIGRLAGGIAADVNNILASILGYADLAMEDLPPGSKGRSSVEQVLKAGRRGKGLIRQIVALGRGERRPERKIRLDELLRTTLDVVRPIVPASIMLESRVTAPTATLTGDETDLHQVLLNLCRNAVQAIGNRPGRIEVVLDAIEVDPTFAERPIDPSEDAAVIAAATEGAPAEAEAARPARLFIGRLEPGPYVRMTVTDTGEGMPPSVLSRIFEPFFTTRKLGEASGLGLAVVHGIVFAHKGAILVASTPGQGSRVEVYLPRGYRATELMAAEIASQSEEPRVLVTGADEADMALARAKLEQLGFAVEAIRGGRAAFEAFRAAPERWRAIVADQDLADMSGEAFSLEISRIRPEIPIILCSGLTKALTLDRVRASGVREFVAKPVDSEDFAGAVERAMRAGPRRG